ncbi:hypothetical protein ASZ90_008509 [hydrocarbon metagenome]|uniref:Uncharacterized protein n=1 Tax=hydrocarbon metagenome TaxID=938273 RepID=A0A0W8FLD9_9ZZZZ
MFYVQRVGIVPRTIRKAAHSGNAPYTNARRHSRDLLAGIHSHRVIPACIWPESTPTGGHSGVVLAGIQEQKNGSPTSPLGDDILWPTRG